MYTISSTVLLRGRHGTCGTRFALVAGVALGDIHGTCAWHVWHLATLSWLLRGSRGTCGTGLALVWRAWSPLVVRRRGALRGRRGTWWHPRCFCVAGGRCGTCFVANYDSEGDGLMPCWVNKEALAGQFASFVIAERPALLSTASLVRPTLTQRGKKYAGFLTHNFFTRNSSTHNSFYTQLFHTQLFHTHTQLFHNFLTHTTLSHTQLFHRQLFETIDPPPSPLSVPFQPLFLIIGRSRLVGPIVALSVLFFLITFFIYIYMYIYRSLSLAYMCVFRIELIWHDWKIQPIIDRVLVWSSEIHEQWNVQIARISNV